MKYKASWFTMMIVVLFAAVLAACAPAAQSTTPPTVNTSGSSSATSLATEAVAAGSGSAPQATAATRINLNTASEADFLTVPGVGDRMVREFMEYRPYVSIAQFEKEIGKYVDDAQVKAYEQYVYVPIAVNDADAVTLMQITGLDATEAGTLIAARPYASNDAFLSELAKVVSETELAAARGLLSNP